MTRAADLARLDLRAALEATLDHAARQRARPAGAGDARRRRPAPSLPIDYAGGQPAGLGAAPGDVRADARIRPSAAIAVPLVVELLSPAQRPVQTTADLPGFWASSYADVRRDLRGRYPRHPWPEDPAAAAPTRRAKPRGT